MVGISDAETKQKLLALKPFPTSETAIDLCRSEESAKANKAELEKCATSEVVVQKVSSYKERTGRSRYRNEPASRSGSESLSACDYCGYQHAQNAFCPARGRECGNCGKVGHFAQVCRSEQPKKAAGRFQPRKGPSKQTKYTKKVSLCVSSVADCLPHKAPQITVAIYSTRNRFLDAFWATPDSASDATVATVDLLDRFQIDRNNLLPATDVNLLAANESHLNCIGYQAVYLKLQGRVAKDRVYFCDGKSTLLLSWYVSRELGILPPDYPNPSSLRITSVNQVAPDIPDRMEQVLGNIPKVPTDAQISAIRENLIQEFPDVFSTDKGLSSMDCAPLQIKLKEGATPFSIRVARTIPHAWYEPARKEIMDMVAGGIIAEVREDEALEWCHPLVCVPKSDGTPRVCVDLTKLNKHVIRPLHPLKTPKQAVSSIPSGMNYFTVFDLRKGYWQLQLDRESQDFTTFLTPWGRFKYLRAPMGLSSTGDAFCYHGDKALLDLGNIQKVVDDCIQYDADFFSHMTRIWATLRRCREKRITLHPKKFLLGQQQVTFCGYLVGRAGIQVDPQRMKAISGFPPPKKITDLRSFFGLVNQLAAFSKDVSGIAEPLRPLLSTKNAFMWLPEHQKAFERVKQALSSPPILAPFGLEFETVLQTDASRKNGLGFALMQKQADGWRLVECGSRFLTDSETRYSTIELELLAVVWAITHRLWIYLQGLTQFSLLIDHKPLIPILNDYTLADVKQKRLQTLKEKLAGFNFQAMWRRGKDHSVPDALSRSPVDQPNEQDHVLDFEINLIAAESINMAVRIISESPLDDKLLSRIADAGKMDAPYHALVDAVVNGFPKGSTGHLAHFSKLHGQLNVVNGVVLFNDRIVVPAPLRREMLARLHSSHQGIEKTERRARQCLYWPGMQSDVENTVRACIQCQEGLPSPKEPLLRDPQPEWVFQEVATDLFSYAGRHFLVYTDRLSGWPVVHCFGKHDPNTREIIIILRKLFGDLGVPVRLRSDNGPQFASSQMKKFLEKWDVKCQTSSPHYPQSNGQAEAAVKVMKAIVRKTTENGNLNDDAFTAAILEYRNTPRANGVSPAEMVFGHSLRSHIPAHRSHFAACWGEKMEQANRNSVVLRMKSDERYDRNASELKPLQIHDSVCVQSHVTKKWDSIGQITGKFFNRDYLVKMPSGVILRRNRRFLRKNYGSAAPDEPMAAVKKSVRFAEDDQLRRSGRKVRKPDRYPS